MSFKKNTAVTGFPFGLVNATDGSPVTTGTPTGYISKDGGAQVAVTAPPTHVGNGQWIVNLSAAEMNADNVGLVFKEASSIPVFFSIKTITKLVSELKDETMRGTDGANTTTPPTTSAIATAVRTEIDTNSTKLDASISSRMATFTYTAPDNASISSILADTNELQLNQGNWITATGFATVNPDNASITAILADTNELQNNQGNWVTATGFSTFNPATDTVAHVTLVDTVTDLTNGSGAGNTPAEIRDAVWGASSASYTTAGTFGKFLDTEVSSVSGGGGITVQDVVDGVWDAPVSAHTIAGTFGKMNDAQVSSRMATFSYVVPDNSSIASILADTNELQTNQNNWVTATGFATINPDNASISAILNDTNELQINQGSWVTADVSGLSTFNPDTDIVARVTLVDTVTINTDMVSEPDDTAVLNAISALNNLSLTQLQTELNDLNDLDAATVKAQVVDVLFNTAVNEPVSAPTHNATLAEKIAYMFAFNRNKEQQTASTRVLRNYNDTANISSFPINSDGVTTTKGGAV